MRHLLLDGITTMSLVCATYSSIGYYHQSGHALFYFTTIVTAMWLCYHLRKVIMNNKMKAIVFDYAMLMIFAWASIASGYNAFSNESLFWLVCFLLSITSFLLQIKECIND